MSIIYAFTFMFFSGKDPTAALDSQRGPELSQSLRIIDLIQLLTLVPEKGRDMP